MSDNLKKVYSTLQNEGYELPKYEEFEADMRDDKLLGEVRQTLVNAGYTPPEFDEFKFDMWGTTPAPTDKSQYTFTGQQLGLEPEEDDMRSMTVERQTSMPTPMWGTISVGENRREAVKDLGSASSGQGGISEYIEMLSGVKSEGQEKAEEQMRIAKERAARGERNWHPYGDTKKPLIESPDIRIGAADNVGLGSPYFNADIYADEAVRRAEEGLKPADGWTEATKRAQANIKHKNRQAQIKKAAEDAVGEMMSKTKNRLNTALERAGAEFDSNYRTKVGDVLEGFALSGDPIKGASVTRRDTYINADDEVRTLTAARSLLNQTEKMVDDYLSRSDWGIYNIGRSAAKAAFDPATWDMGFADVNVADKLLSVVEKADKDEPLSESEQLLLDAAINQQVMQGYYSELSGWQKAGKMFGESLPFMAQIAVNPLGSMSKYAGSKAAKAVLKHISKKVSKKAIERILARTAGLTAQTLGDLGTSYGMALTSNLGNTTADALNRQIGDIQYDFDDNGVARYNGRLNVKEAGEAWLDAINNQAFEFYSEKMGEYFAPIFKGMGKLGGKVLDNFGMEGVNRWVSDFAKKGSVRQLNQFLEKTQFHGFASEYAEEIANDMLNAAFVGDMTMEDVFSKDNLIDTAIGLSVMGAIGPMVGTAGYARAKYKEKQALNEADEEGRRLMGHAWDSFADAVRRSKNGEELSANLRETLNSFGRKALPGEDMRQILSYAQAYNRYKAVEEVSAAAVAEGVMDERDLELQRQYENGQTTTDKHGLRVAFEATADAVEGIIPLNIGENTAYDIADEYDEQGDTDTATAIRVFLSARAAHSGMTAQIREQAQSELESANAEIDSHTNKTDGNIYSVTLGGGLNGYVTGGTVITDSDGDIDIDATREANESGYVYVNVDGVIEPTSVDKFVSLDGVESAADAKAAREAEINAALNAQYEELTAPVETQEATPASTEVTPAAPAETAAAPVNNAPTVSEVAENAARALGLSVDELNDAIKDEQKGLAIAANYDRVDDTDSADAIRAYVAERFGTPAVQPAQVNNATAAEVGNNGAENISALEGVAPIPVEKRGKEERQAFHLVPVERTTEELYNSGLDQQEIDAFVQANIDEINSDIEKHSKKQPKMGANIAAYKAAKEEWQAQNEDLSARLNYYKGLQDHIKGITRSNTAEAINDPIADVSDITTPEEFIAAQLGGIKITPESFRKETGLSAAEQKALVGVIVGKDKGGVSIERAAEIITDNYSEELAGLGFKGDMMDVRNAIIDILSGGNPKTYAKRAAEARQMQVVDERRDQMDYIARQLGFDSVDEMIAYEETLLPRIFEQYAGFDEQTYYTILVNDYNNDYDTTRESETVGRGGEVLQDEQPTNASGTKPVGTGQEGGAAASSVQSNGANVATSGNQEVSEPVGNSEQLNQSEDSLEMGAEGDAPGQSGVYSLSELRDNEGNRFYQKNGSIDLWDLSPLFEQARRQNAPIRLTERNVNHILDEHKKELGDSEESVIKFLDDVFSTARILRKARSAGIFVVVENTKTDKAAIIRLYPSKHGDYYNVESAGYYRKNKWKDTENVIAELSEPTQSVTASDVSKPQVPEEGGRELLNAETATTSADESTASVSNSQENSVKSGENTQNWGEITRYSLNTLGSSSQMLKDIEALRKSNREEFEKIQPVYEYLYKAKERGLYPDEIAELKGILKGTSLESKVDSWFTPVVEEQSSTNVEKSQEIEDNSTTGGESGSSEIPNNSTISQESEQVGDQVEKNLSWEEMSAQERMNYASKNPLTIDEIKKSTSDEVNKSNAIAYISGTENLITQLSYLKVYEDVRIRPTDSPSDNGDRNETQLAETNSGESANRGAGGESGNIPLSVSETGSGKTPSIANVGENSEGGSDSLSGERGDSDVRAEESSMDGIPAGNNNSAGSRRGGRNGSNGRRTGRRNSSENTARGGEITPQSNAELIDDELNNALSSFKDTLSEFVKAGKDTLSISLTGLNGKQLEILPKLISEGTKIGYILVKKGLNKLAQWSKAMKSYIGQPLSNAGLSDAEVDAFIDELWNSRFPIGDEVHTIGEWASIIGMEETRKAVRASISDKKAAQDAAESVNVKIADAENIAETLPFLLPQQQDDVLKAETQFFDRSHNDREHAFGKGYMFTNGTGTGKTYTGLGIVKRFIKQGKGRILIVTPSQQKVTDWISDAKNLNISLRSLDEFAKQNGTTATQTAGEGAVITTYANFRENAALLEGVFDLVVYDESHRLLENKTGTETRGVQQHYMITNRDEDAAFMRLREINPVYKKIREAQEKFISIYEKEIENKSQKNVPRLHTPLSEDYRTNFPKLYKAKEAYNKAEQAWGKEELKLREQAKKDAAVTKVVFLSATPFNTRDNLDYAERYIFMYPKENTETIGSYRHQSPKTRFYLEHFGGAYKFRYGRLENAPQNADVIARQEVAFSDYLQNTLNTMSGRVIDSEYDYSRDFPTVSLEMGPRINSAIDSITEIEELRPLWSARNKVWRDYNYSSALFETMKVSAMLPRLKQHLEKGRKIVIFHRRTDTKEPIIPPFKLMMSIAEKELKETQKEDERKKLASAIRKFKKDYADLFEWEQTLNYSMPREQLAEAFGKDNVLFFSGKESAKVKNEAVKLFNDDNSGKNIIVIQEASGKEGISLHDRTGKHQRVVITLALPQSPITALQIEGRIYRIGNKSNAIFEYPILGLNSEIVLFGQNFNNSVSTTENLALGSKARSLRSSFARGIEERSGDISVDGQGIGGKEADANTVTENDPFDNAVLDYYTNQKITTRRDNREGIDYYPTPEPLGFMMNIWGRVKDSDDILEPSAGHGAIARYVPMENALTAVEPSQSLFARLQIKAGGAAGRSFVNDVFENYNIINKHDVILMNPPFGVQGKLASEHVAKAYKHLNEGGRIVAIVPEGKAQSRIEKWLGEQKDAVVVGEVLLPDVTFVQAGTSIRCRVLVIDKISNEAKRNNAATQKITHNLGYVESIDEFFDTLRNINMPDRTIDTQLIMEKKVRCYASDLRGIKGVKEVYVNPESVVVRTKGWRNFNIVWGDLSGNALKKSLAQQYSQFAKKIPYADETSQEIMKELQGIICKLANMTEDEMERFIANPMQEDDTLYRENDDIRFRSVGGNSGYVGYSMSKRAAEAREEGRFPKTDFKKEYDMPQQTLDALVEAEIIDNSEWHHTSKIGNRTTFYGWTDEAFADIYAENKKEIDAMVKEVNANIAELEKEERDFLDSWKGYQYPESFDWNAYRRRAHELEDLSYNERMDILHSEFPETAEKERHDSRQQEFSREINNRKREQRKRINELFTKNVNYIVSLFNRENAGAAPCVVIKNIDTLEAQLKEAGFSNESIEDSKEGLRDGYLAGYDPNEDYVVIYDSNASEYEIIGYLWHENAHKEIGKVYTQEEIDNAFHFYFKNNIDKVYELLKDYPESLVHEEALIKAFEKDYQHTLDVIDGNDTETREKRMSFIEFFRPIVNNIRYGERENTTGEQQGAKSVRPDNVGELEVRNSETQRETERREERIQKVNSEIISAVNKLAAELHTDVEIVKEVSAIPDARKRGAKGWYDGRVYLVLPNATSVDDAVETVLHEVVGHKGLRALFGEGFNDMLADVFKNAPKQIRKAILDRALNMMAEGRKDFLHVATEEYLAEQAERGFDDYSFLDKAKGWILKLLRSIGLKSKISDSEIRYMLWRSYNLLKGNNTLAEIENIAMQARLGVGEYRARGEVIDANHRDTSNAQEQYNKNVEGFTDRVKEAWIDKTRSVKKMQEAIEKETGNKIADYANVYLLMNQMPGRVREKMDKFLKKHLDPLGEFLKKMFKNDYLKGSEEQKQKQVERYLNCKHGIERNIDMSVRAALTNEEGVLDRKTYEQYTTEKEAIWEKKLPWAEEVKELTELSKKYNAKEKDYSGLTALFPSEDSYNKIRSKAIKRVEDFENAFDKKVIDELWKRVGDINELTLKESYKSGLLSNDLYSSIKRQFKYYVPLRGFEETTADEVYEYLSREDVPISGPIRRAEGRKSEAEKIFATMANMYNSAVSMGAKNRIKQALFQMAVMNKTSLLSVNPSYYKEDGRGGYEPFLPSITDNMSEDEIREEMEKYEEDVKKGLKDGTIKRHREGLNIDYKSEKWQRDEHAVRVKRNGKEFVVFVNGSPRVAQAVNGLLDKRGGKFIQTLQAANRWRARNITGYNVNFTLSNLARDIQEATITAFAKEGVAYAWKFEKELMKNLAAFRAEDGVKYRGIHNLYYRYFKDELDLTDKREKYFKEFMENGGETGFHSMMSIEDYQKRIKKAVDSNLLNATGKGLAAVNDTVEFVNRGIENACRFATYVASRESGKSIMQSVNDAKEASVNFNRVGSGAMGNLYFRASKMFLNPAIQGLVKRLTLLRDHPVRMTPIVAMELLTGYIVGDLAMIAMKFIWDALGFDDDDEENNAYYNLSDFVRRSNVIIPLVDGKFIKIPLSHESRVAHGIGEILSSYMNGHLEYENIPAQVYAVLTQAIPLNPTAPDSFTDENLLEDIAKVLIPDAFALPAYEALALNRDFTGRQITGRSDYNEHRPEYMRAGKGTPEFFIEMSRTINDWTGGSDIERGVLENAVGGVNNPTFYEYMLIANLGGIATMTAQLYKTAQALKGDEEYQEARNYPVINRFFEDTSSYEEEPQERTRRDYERAYRFFKEKVKDYSDVLNNYKAAENMGIDGLEDELEDIKGEKMEEKRDAFKPYKQDLDELYDDLNEAKDKKDQSKITEIEKDILEKKIEAVKEMEKDFSWE